MLISEIQTDIEKLVCIQFPICLWCPFTYLRQLLPVILLFMDLSMIQYYCYLPAITGHSLSTRQAHFCLPVM